VMEIVVCSSNHGFLRMPVMSLHVRRDLRETNDLPRYLAIKK